MNLNQSQGPLIQKELRKLANPKTALVKHLGILFLMGIGLVGCNGKEPFLFSELPASRTGIKFENRLTETPELNILNYLYYYNGAGVMSADFNGDGLPDLYFSGNQVEDALYINQGNLTFEDITLNSGISNQNGWTTGVTHADVNGDGLLDIYICKASGYRALTGRNLLYIHLGNNSEGIPQFRESAQEYGLDFSGLSTQAAFFDFDLDGDLDMFLLNHSVHPNRTYGKGSQREGYDPISGDRLYRNDNGRFVDISASAGIFQGKAGYGLGIGISDLNGDGYPDIYIGNDFFENDYLYINLGNGTFKEVISGSDSQIGHTSHYSMGNTLADLNNDGLPDILSLDMLPEDPETYKTSGLEYGFPIYQQYLNNGFAPQYMQNTFQLNLGNGMFSEVAFLAGLAATEWSWGVLAADFDNDGLKDVFISNGIKGATNDMDYMNFIANESIQRQIDKGMTHANLPLTREIPAKIAANYLYRNSGNLHFENMTGKWITARKTYSHGAIYTDLDRDGDLDLVVNPVDEPALVYENKSQGSSTYRIGFKGSVNNTFGIGCKVIAYAKDKTLLEENFPTRGYLSAINPEIQFGFGASHPDSIQVVWPGGAYETFKNQELANHITADIKNAAGNYYSPKSYADTVPWKKYDSILSFYHRENPTLDFDREPLIVYAASHFGPEAVVSDFNKDGLDDIVICGGKRQATQLFFQEPAGKFRFSQPELFEAHALNEDTAVAVADLDRDGWPDLIVGSGGNEFKNGTPLEPRIYMNRNGHLETSRSLIPGLYINASGIDTLDIDRDGSIDLLITADVEPANFGKPPRHYLLQNDGQGNFRDITLEKFPDLLSFGSITDVVIADLNGDDFPEIAIGGLWSPVNVYAYTDGIWTRQTQNGLENSEGFWFALTAADVDNDGDMDILAGNWGLNSRLKASLEEPITLYLQDFDDNGTVDPMVTYYFKGREMPFASKDELTKQLPIINKKYRTYSAFAAASLKDIFGVYALSEAEQKKVYELASCIFLNNGKGQFQKKQLPAIAQVSPIFDFEVADFDGDNLPDIFPVGNLFEISTQLGRLDALNGVLLHNSGDGNFEWWQKAAAPVSGSCRQIMPIKIGDKEGLIIVRNNNTPVILTQEFN